MIAHLLVEAGAGSGKTALMAGRVAMMLTAGVPPRDIVAITFTEAAASELLERIERFAGALLGGTIPRELQNALSTPLSAAQRESIERGASALDEITCTTIHGFCQQFVRPYPVETGIDPGAEIIDPAAAELAFQDLMDAWLSARFGRDRSSEGLGRIPPMKGAGGSEDFFAELVNASPDAAVDLITKAAIFSKTIGPLRRRQRSWTRPSFRDLASAIDDFAAWYNGCQVVEGKTAEVSDRSRPHRGHCPRIGGRPRDRQENRRAAVPSGAKRLQTGWHRFPAMGQEGQMEGCRQGMREKHGLWRAAQLRRRGPLLGLRRRIP